MYRTHSQISKKKLKILLVNQEESVSMPSILTPSSTLIQSLVLHERTLDVVRAVTRDEAGGKATEKADKRNMYLLREGGTFIRGFFTPSSVDTTSAAILPNSPAAEALTPPEIERRTASFNARRALPTSNPSLFVPTTCLSIRQIPIFVTGRMIKRLTIHALRESEGEVKKGGRRG